MSMPLASHFGDAVRAQVLQSVDDEARAFAGAVEVEAPQAVVARIVVAVGQQLAEQFDLVARGPGFFGRNALVVFHREIMAQALGRPIARGVDNCFAKNRVTGSQRSPRV